jgi:DNA-directed RNA polymerase subunit RPC12/RpoP
VVLTWTAPAAPANINQIVTGYKISYSTLNLSVPENVATATSATRVTYEPPVPAAPGLQQKATISNLEDGELYYFRVEAVDNGNRVGPGAVYPLATKADPNAVTADTIRDANLDIEVTVTEGVNGTGNLVNWTMPANTTGILGVQVWRCTSSDKSSCIPVANLTMTTQAFQDRSFHDVNGQPGDRYLVTAYYGTTPGKGYAKNAAEAEQIPGWEDLSPQGVGGGGLFGLPLWAVLVAALLLLLLIAGGVIFAMRSRRTAAASAQEWPEEGLPEEGLPADEGGIVHEAVEGAEPMEGVPAAVPEAAPEPKASLTHYITCPKCSTEFSASGPKPLSIQCPNCGVRGTLK